MTRPSWDKYFIDMCDLVSTRATCPRASVGSVIVKNNQVLGAGYDGSLPGQPHCIDIGCCIENSHCVSVNHSEANAIAQAARRGIALEGSTIYCSLLPCWTCLKLIIAAGITTIVYKDKYGSEELYQKIVKTACECGVVLKQYKE